MLEYYDVLRETHKEWEGKFGDFIEGLRSRGVCVILFGSKASQKDNLLSDFDLVIITKDSKLDLEIDFPAELFVYNFEECLKEIKNKNTILLDAFTMGKLIFDNIDVYNRLNNEVERTVKEKGVIRTTDGWIAEEIARTD